MSKESICAHKKKKYNIQSTGSLQCVRDTRLGSWVGGVNSLSFDQCNTEDAPFWKLGSCGSHFLPPATPLDVG